MIRVSHVAAFCSLVAFAGASARAATAPPAGSVEPTDYASADTWVCRPGKEVDCSSGLDAIVEGPDGTKRATPFVAATDPAIDCFYVYPTVSQERSLDSDLADSPEIRKVTNDQVGRLSSRCRVFAPIYRQTTLYGLHRYLRGEGRESGAATRDIEAAWHYYLDHDNRGRGVVFVGHSQGTIVLQKIIARFVDGKPAQRLLVSAFLAGDPSLAVPPGARVGGTFAHIPVCAAASQTGCIYVWGSYLAGDPATARYFGAARDDGLTSACASPAAPSGGSGSLEFFRRKSIDAPAGDPPWIESVGELSGACDSDAAGNGFIVTVKPGPRARALTALLASSEIAEGWGLHIDDVALVQGNILDVLDAEIATWGARRDR